MSANEDLFWNWLENARTRGGGFVSAFAQAILRADPENYRTLRSTLAMFVLKYPEYGTPDERRAARDVIQLALDRLTGFALGAPLADDDEERKNDADKSR